MTTKTKTKEVEANELLTTKEVALRLGISDIRIRQLIKEDRLPAQLMGNSYVINSSDLHLIEKRQTGRPKTRAEQVK